jgi:hypothetical protein
VIRNQREKMYEKEENKGKCMNFGSKVVEPPSLRARSWPSMRLRVFQGPHQSDFWAFSRKSTWKYLKYTPANRENENKPKSSE